MKRRARLFPLSHRVAIDAPGYLALHGAIGTVAYQRTADGPVIVLRDSRPLSRAATTVAAHELVELIDQTPNPIHQPPAGHGYFWWRK